MPWTIRMVPAPGDEPGDTPWKDLRPGDMWFAPHLLKYPEGHLFRPAAKYFARNAHRPPLIVALPSLGGGRVDWPVDGPCWRDGKPYGDGWDVSGEPPLITVSPSIDIRGSYHGFIQNGVITDDCEGRRHS